MHSTMHFFATRQWKYILIVLHQLRCKLIRVNMFVADTLFPSSHTPVPLFTSYMYPFISFIIETFIYSGNVCRVKGLFFWLLLVIIAIVISWKSFTGDLDYTKSNVNKFLLFLVIAILFRRQCITVLFTDILNAGKRVTKWTGYFRVHRFQFTRQNTITHLQWLE